MVGVATLKGGPKVDCWYTDAIMHVYAETTLGSESCRRRLRGVASSSSAINAAINDFNTGLGPASGGYGNLGSVGSVSGGSGSNTALPLDTGSGGYGSSSLGGSIGSASGNTYTFNMGGGGYSAPPPVLDLSGLSTGGSASAGNNIVSSNVGGSMGLTAADFAAAEPGFEAALQNPLSVMNGGHLITVQQTAAPVIAAWNSFYSITLGGQISAGLGRLGQYLNGAGYRLAANGHSDLGTAVAFLGNLSQTGSAMANPVSGFLQMSANGAQVMQEYGVVAGLAYSEGSLVGGTQIAQAISGENFVTGQALSTIGRWSQGAGGFGALAGTAALGLGTAGADATLWDGADTAVTVPVYQPSGQTYSVMYEMRLDPADWGTSHSVHLNRANAALDAEMQSDPQFAAQVEDLIPGAGGSVSSVGARRTPLGWTWHHAAEPGLMQLVPEAQHTNGSIFWGAMHPNVRGGYAIWALPAGALGR